MRKTIVMTLLLTVILGLFFAIAESKENKVKILETEIKKLRKQGYKIKDLTLIDKNISGFLPKDFEKNGKIILEAKCPDIISCGAIKEEIVLMKIKKGETLIDIGTGQSNYLLKLSQIVGKNGKVITTDINPNSKIYGEWKLNTIISSGLYKKQLIGQEVGKNIVFKINSADDLMLDEEIADRILLIQVHLYNRDGPEYQNIVFTKSIIKSLKKRGKIILIDYYKKEHKNLPSDIAIKKIKNIYGKFNCKIIRKFRLKTRGKWDEVYGVELIKI